MGDEELRNTENLSIVKYHSLVNSTKNDFFVRNTSSLNTYWQTVYVLYARSVRHAIDFIAVGRNKKLQRTTHSFQKAVLQPTAIYLIKRASDNLSFFMQLSRKGLVSPSNSSVVDFSNNSDQTVFARYEELLKFQEAIGPLTAIERTMVLYYSSNYLCFRF